MTSPTTILPTNTTNTTTETETETETMISRSLLRCLPRQQIPIARFYSSKPPGPGLGGSFGNASPELGVGEISNATFRISPLRRHGEDLATMRARLLYQSRKRGILETDLLLSTFADVQLPTMERGLLEQYDLFLDENDWDIYYWTTQNAPEGEAVAAAAVTEAEAEAEAAPVAERVETTEQSAGMAFGEGPVGEWVQTVGRVREPYRPPPSRWMDSEILGLLRAHVKARAEGGQRTGLGRMPDVRMF